MCRDQTKRRSSQLEALLEMGKCIFLCCLVMCCVYTCETCALDLLRRELPLSLNLRKRSDEVRNALWANVGLGFYILILVHY